MGIMGERLAKALWDHVFPPCWTFLFGKQKDVLFFWGVICWMLHIGRARHPRPGSHNIVPGQLSIEFISIGGWLTSGDFAMDSCAQFLAVAEHRLIPSRARSVCHQLRRAGHHSVWAPACQDKIAGGHAGVGVVSLGGAPLSLPSFVTPQFQEFFRLGRVLRTTPPTAQGGVVHLFVVYGYQGAEEDAGQRLSCSSVHLPSRGRARWVGGTALATVATQPIFQECVFLFPFFNCRWVC